jgi:hypothetical protein
MLLVAGTTGTTAAVVAALLAIACKLANTSTGITRVVVGRTFTANTPASVVSAVLALAGARWVAAVTFEAG